LPLQPRGEPYTRAKFDQAQAEKIYYDQPNPVFRNIDALGFCARLVAILESASSHKNYQMALYRVNSALDSLRGEFGMDEKLYRYNGPNHVNNGMAVQLLRGILTRENQLQDRFNRVQRLPAAKPKKKPLSKKKRRR
jgi:hypothetical protein